MLAPYLESTKGQNFGEIQALPRNIHWGKETLSHSEQQFLIAAKK